MAEKLIYWLIFNLVIALFPLYFSLFVYFISGKPLSNVWSKSTEVAFFSVIISATALADIVFKGLHGRKKSTGLLFLSTILVVSLLASAALYGSLIVNLITEDTITQEIAKDMAEITTKDIDIKPILERLLAQHPSRVNDLNGLSQYRAKLLNYSIWIAVGIFILGTIAQVWIGLIEPKTRLRFRS